MSIKRERDGRKPRMRRSRKAPVSAASVFPSARPAAAMCGIGDRRLVKNAPSAIPGQMRQPSKSTALRAIPEAGQTGETLPLVKGAARPTLPAAKYAIQTRAVLRRYVPYLLSTGFPVPFFLSKNRAVIGNWPGEAKFY